VLVERHLLHTGSRRALTLLDDWDTALDQFRKVTPRDYRAALEALDVEQTPELEAAE
jgi:glutamate synthase (NADPH/NADH) large chain